MELWAEVGSGEWEALFMGEERVWDGPERRGGGFGVFNIFDCHSGIPQLR